VDQLGEQTVVKQAIGGDWTLASKGPTRSISWREGGMALASRDQTLALKET
jgi:hypothetical protein